MSNRVLGLLSSRLLKYKKKNQLIQNFTLVSLKKKIFIEVLMLTICFIYLFIQNCYTFINNVGRRFYFIFKN